MVPDKKKGVTPTSQRTLMLYNSKMDSPGKKCVYLEIQQIMQIFGQLKAGEYYA